jgi:hypothetical protein
VPPLNKGPPPEAALGEDTLRTNLKIGLYICLLLALGTTIIQMALGFESAQEEDLFFVIRVAAILGAIITALGLLITRNRKTN